MSLELTGADRHGETGRRTRGPRTRPGAKALKEGGTIEPVREILWGASAGVRKYETAEEIPPEMRKLIVRLMVVQADTEFASIQQHRPWLDRAPTLEDRWIEARIVADEARHGLQACRILRDFGEEGQKMIDELLLKPEGHHKLDAFNMKFDRWSDAGAFCCFVDRVGVYQLRAFQECSYGPLARAMPLMLSEEQLHLNFGASRPPTDGARRAEVLRRQGGGPGGDQQVVPPRPRHVRPLELRDEPEGDLRSG